MIFKNYKIFIFCFFLFILFFLTYFNFKNIYVFENIKNFKTLKVNILWENKISQDAYEYSNICINSNILYFIVNKKFLYACNKNTGNVLWSKLFIDNFSNYINVKNEIILVCTEANDVICLNKYYGNLLWRLKLDCFVESLPIIDIKYIFLQDVEGKLIALDFYNGKIIWTYKSSIFKNYLFHCDLLLYKNRVFAGFIDGKYFSFRKIDGKILWGKNLLFKFNYLKNSYKLYNLSFKCVIDNNILYLCYYFGKLISLNCDDGGIIWNRSTSINSNILIYNNMLYVFSNFGIYIINKYDGEIIDIILKLKEIILFDIFKINGSLFIVDKNNYIYLISGSFIYKYYLDHTIYSIYVLNDIVYLLCKNGYLFSLTLEIDLRC